MNKIAQIREMLQCLPEKDIPLANKLLDKRQFVELKELIDSDVSKISRKKFLIESSAEEDQEPTEEYMETEDKYIPLKTLQMEVTEQARAFESDLDDEEFFIPEDYD